MRISDWSSDVCSSDLLNLAYPLWGCLSGALLEVWDEHLDELLGLFIRELHTHGGPLLKESELRLHLDLYIATVGLAGLMISPQHIEYRLPEAVNASGRSEEHTSELQSLMRISYAVFCL